MLNQKEASARIKINKLLEESGWRFEDNEKGRANIQLEPGVKYSDLGDDFENQAHGFIDFLLLDKDGRALVVVEAKKESIDPLSAKEQARNYARNIGARFIILSNGNIHYFWDTKHGNPDTISKFPTQDSITQYETYIPNPVELVQTEVDENYVVSTQIPSFATDPNFQDEKTRTEYLKINNLKQLRPYQVQAIKALQESAKNGNQRFLFEMATGTGKTLISAAVIKLFLKSGNARRVLFLVDRLELEDQAQKAFVHYLGKDYRSVIYKENRDSWSNANIVVSTIQTFLVGDRYKKEYDAMIKTYDETKFKYEQLEIESSQQAAKHQMIKDYINTLKKQNKPLTKFDGLMWGSLLESATIKDKDTIVFKFKDGTEING